MHGLQGGGDFVPADFGGCRLWVRSDLGVSLASSGRVQAWKDQITKTDYFCLTDANRPDYGTGLKGRPKLVFSGNQALTNTSFFLSGPMSVFFMIQLQALPGASTSVVPYIIQGAAGNALRSLMVYINLGGYSPFTFKHDNVTSSAFIGASGYTLAARCYVVTYNGGTTTNPANYTMDDLGFPLTVGTSGTAGSATAFFTSIGAAVDDPAGTLSPNSMITGDVYEFALWNRPLSLKERIDLYAYANRLYGVHL